MKSFRAAADRIVREESSSSTDALRLLGSAVDPARTIANEHDEWDMRLAALAAIGGYDALAVVTSKPARLSHSHNLADPRTVQGAVAEVFDEVTRRRVAVQLHAPTTLADGRVCSEMLVAPLTALEGVEGVLVALRSGRGFTAPDAITASSVGTVLGVELRRAAAATQDAQTVRQSLALFELARIGLGRDSFGERLRVMVEVVATSLGHDVTQLWLLRGGGSLQLRAAHPQEPLVLEIARPRDHARLAQALEGDPFRGTDPSLRSWIKRTSRELIIAPLRGAESVAGLLILGRWSEGYGDEDLRMATQYADFFAEIVANDALIRHSRAAARAEPQADAEDGATGS